MGQDATITSATLAWRPDEQAGPNARPQLVLVATSDDPHAPSSRHLLDDIDEVEFGRGERSTERRAVDGRRVLQLRIPDQRMSSTHGRLVRGPSGWVLDDPDSKNGAVVDGAVTRRVLIGDGALIQLGHTFFLFRNAEVEADAEADVDDARLVGGAAAMQTFDGALAQRFARLARVAPSADVSVVLHGETGTGKEVVARAVHELSGRSGAFIAVNCGALPPALIEAELFGHRRGAFTGAVGERLGLVRSADGGTLFLDEIGELPAQSQAAFLRVLQEREVVPVGVDHAVKVDVRLCAATLRDLDALVASGQFRADLYARLMGATFELVPLHRRRADLGLLIRRLLATIKGGPQVRFMPPAMFALLRHSWPLNIRELQKALATAISLADDGLIEVGHLPETLRRRPRSEPPETPGPHDDAAAGDAEAGPDDALRAQLVSLLTLHKGNIVAVSLALNTRRQQVYRWVDRFGLQLDSFRRRSGG